MKTSDITEKRMQNRRFFKTERAIFVAYYKFKDYPSAKKLAWTAGVSRSTLYRHHKKVQSIPADYEDYLLKNYTRTIKKFLKNDSSLKIIFLRTLIFITNNREFFGILFKDNRKEIIKRMFECLKPRILDEWHLSGDIDKMYSVYKNGILGIIEMWHKQKFANNRLEPILNDILYLTRASRRHLLPLQ
ncbi:TetR family transcriptional regulator C-terminal domain-containing protein [Candidatus Saccharibacteria bacterium]|nr:TetR family transcriptional regulator C-terminal domain-containing protein [Candidatus Saccharibacteria bacterium]